MTFLRLPFHLTTWTRNIWTSRAYGIHPTWAAHDLYRPHQFTVWHNDLSGDVVVFQMPRPQYASLVSIWLVRRRLAVTNTYRTHDSHAADSICTKLCFMACLADDGGHHGNWYLYPLLIVWCFFRTNVSALVLLSMANRDSSHLLFADTVAEDKVYPFM